ncbi:hypothetical protein MPH_13054 [Macrophomina phaseolina MS6]|uniref:Uncharacterized protein n=1 Tax=Macrophomina phaseolina (strain MS6) TaxID=1126212 RepID=K2RAD8_MACPH|nr:hypothetical protein MPH_13054 [Macrophomina phaseolina MS6]
MWPQEYIGADKLGRDVGFLKEGFEMMEARPATRDVFTRVEEGVERIAAENKRRTTDEKEICYSEVNDHMHPHNVRGALEAHDEKFHKAWKKKKECEKVYNPMPFSNLFPTHRIYNRAQAFPAITYSVATSYPDPHIDLRRPPMSTITTRNLAHDTIMKNHRRVSMLTIDTLAIA